MRKKKAASRKNTCGGFFICTDSKMLRLKTFCLTTYYLLSYYLLKVRLLPFGWQVRNRRRAL
jgi:hypothetical protein